MKNTTHVARSYFGGLIIDCKSLTTSPILFTKRLGNRVAHYLANLAFSLGEKFWIDEVPYQVDLLIASDINDSISLEGQMIYLILYVTFFYVIWSFIF